MKYLNFVRSLPCAACMAPAPSEAHHAIDVGLHPGMGRKASDLHAMPLCRVCHAKLHAGDARLHEAQAVLVLQTQDQAGELICVDSDKRGR